MLKDLRAATRHLHASSTTTKTTGQHTNPPALQLPNFWTQHTLSTTIQHLCEITSIQTLHSQLSLIKICAGETQVALRPISTLTVYEKRQHLIYFSWQGCSCMCACARVFVLVAFTFLVGDKFFFWNVPNGGERHSWRWEGRLYFPQHTQDVLRWICICKCGHTNRIENELCLLILGWCSKAWWTMMRWKGCTLTVTLLKDNLVWHHITNAVRLRLPLL